MKLIKIKAKTERVYDLGDKGVKVEICEKDYEWLMNALDLGARAQEYLKKRYENVIK